MADLRDLLANAADGPDDGFDPGAVRRRVLQRARRRRAAGTVAALTVVGLTAIGVTARTDGTTPDDQVVASDDGPAVTEPGPVDTPPTDGPTTSTRPSVSATGVPPTTSTTTTTAPPAELDDGRHFGYLVGYDGSGATTIGRFDLAQFFIGDEADAAAAEDGVIADGEEVENDYYIRNTNARLRDVAFAGGAAITVVDCGAGCESVPADLPALQGRPTPTPVWLTVSGGVVTAADEQYLP